MMISAMTMMAMVTVMVVIMNGDHMLLMIVYDGVDDEHDMVMLIVTSMVM